MYNEPYNPPGAEPPFEEEYVYQITGEEKTLALISHLGALFSFLVPLIIWIIKRNDSDFVEHHACEALNFQITLFLAWVAAVILTIIIDGGPIMCILFPLLLICNIVFIILGAVAANKGELYEYPISLRMVH